MSQRWCSQLFRPYLHSYHTMFIVFSSYRIVCTHDLKCLPCLQLLLLKNIKKDTEKWQFVVCSSSCFMICIPNCRLKMLSHEKEWFFNFMPELKSQNNLLLLIHIGTYCSGVKGNGILNKIIRKKNIFQKEALFCKSVC